MMHSISQENHSNNFKNDNNTNKMEEEDDLEEIDTQIERQISTEYIPPNLSQQNKNKIKSNIKNNVSDDQAMDQLEQQMEIVLSKELALQRPSKNQKFQWTSIKTGQQNVVSDFNVAEKKQFDYKPNCGHIWYKNMNIPQIKVTLNKQEEKNKNQQQQNSQIFAKIYSVRQQIQNKSTKIIPLSGKNETQISWGESEFQGLRFTQTSYSHRGSRYFLVVFLVEKNGNQYVQYSDYQVSPPIYIESRKKAYLERQTYFTQFFAFHPNKLEKNLAFSEDIEKSNAGEETQDQQTQKLIDFLINPRIRLKIYHPLFLFFKFPKAIDLFINKQIIESDPSKNQDFFYDMQKHIIKMNDKMGNSANSQKNVKLKDKLFIISIKGFQNQQMQQSQDNQTDKIMKILMPLEGPLMTILSGHTDSLPTQFSKLEYIETMPESYKKCYFLYQDMRQAQPQTSITSNTNSLYNLGSESDANLDNTSDQTSKNYRRSKTMNLSNNNQNMPQDMSNQISFHQACFDLSVETYPQLQKQSLTKISVFKNEKEEVEMSSSFPKKFQKLNLNENTQTNMSSSSNIPANSIIIENTPKNTPKNADSTNNNISQNNDSTCTNSIINNTLGTNQMSGLFDEKKPNAKKTGNFQLFQHSKSNNTNEIKPINSLFSLPNSTDKNLFNLNTNLNNQLGNKNQLPNLNLFNTFQPFNLNNNLNNNNNFLLNFNNLNNNNNNNMNNSNNNPFMNFSFQNSHINQLSNAHMENEDDSDNDPMNKSSPTKIQTAKRNKMEGENTTPTNNILIPKTNKRKNILISFPLFAKNEQQQSQQMSGLIEQNTNYDSSNQDENKNNNDSNSNIMNTNTNTGSQKSIEQQDVNKNDAENEEHNQQKQVNENQQLQQQLFKQNQMIQQQQQQLQAFQQQQQNKNNQTNQIDINNNKNNNKKNKQKDQNQISSLSHIPQI